MLKRETENKTEIEFKEGGIERLGDALIDAARMPKGAEITTKEGKGAEKRKKGKGKPASHARRGRSGTTQGDVSSRFDFGGKTGQARRLNVLRCMPHILYCQEEDKRQKAVLLLAYYLLKSRSESFVQNLLRIVDKNRNNIFENQSGGEIGQLSLVKMQLVTCLADKLKKVKYLDNNDEVISSFSNNAIHIALADYLDGKTVGTFDILSKLEISARDITASIASSSVLLESQPSILAANLADLLITAADTMKRGQGGEEAVGKERQKKKGILQSAKQRLQQGGPTGRHRRELVKSYSGFLKQAHDFGKTIPCLLILALAVLSSHSKNLKANLANAMVSFGAGGVSTWSNSVFKKNYFVINTILTKAPIEAAIELIKLELAKLGFMNEKGKFVFVQHEDQFFGLVKNLNSNQSKIIQTLVRFSKIIKEKTLPFSSGLNFERLGTQLLAAVEDANITFNSQEKGKRYFGFSKKQSKVAQDKYIRARTKEYVNKLMSSGTTNTTRSKGLLMLIYALLNSETNFAAIVAKRIKNVVDIESTDILSSTEGSQESTEVGQVNKKVEVVLFLEGVWEQVAKGIGDFVYVQDRDNYRALKNNLVNETESVDFSLVGLAGSPISPTASHSSSYTGDTSLTIPPSGM